MPGYTLELPEAAIAFLEEKAAGGGYASPGEYVCALLQGIADREWKQEVKKKLQEAEQEPAVEMTAGDWEWLRQRIYDRHPELAKTETVSP